MNEFSYIQATTTTDAVALAQQEGSMFLAGGTELLNWCRIGITSPTKLIDIGRIPGLDKIEKSPSGGLRIGATAKLNDVAQHPLVTQGYPALSQAILKAASAQLRNLATIGGNPLQRVRCPYFRSEEPTPCNKRQAGSGCAAIDGFNDKHAIFGWTKDCVAVSPSDPAVALAALDAVFVIHSRAGQRRIPATEFNVLPSHDASQHNVLRSDELIIGVEIPSHAPKSAYLKIRERESYEFATVSAAVALDLDGRIIRQARIALGSVAMRPWRLHEAERLLIGQPVDSEGVKVAIAAGFSDARPLSGNSYKIPMAQAAARRAIKMAAEA